MLARVKAGRARSPSSSRRSLRFEHGVCDWVQLNIVHAQLVERSTTARWPARGAWSSRGLLPVRHGSRAAVRPLRAQPEQLCCTWHAGLGCVGAWVGWEWAGWAAVAPRGIAGPCRCVQCARQRRHVCLSRAYCRDHGSAARMMNVPRVSVHDVRWRVSERVSWSVTVTLLKPS